MFQTSEETAHVCVCPAVRVMLQQVLRDQKANKRDNFHVSLPPPKKELKMHSFVDQCHLLCDYCGRGCELWLESLLSGPPSPYFNPKKKKVGMHWFVERQQP